MIEGLQATSEDDARDMEEIIETCGKILKFRNTKVTPDDLSKTHTNISAYIRQYGHPCGRGGCYIPQHMRPSLQDKVVTTSYWGDHGREYLLSKMSIDKKGTLALETTKALCIRTKRGASYFIKRYKNSPITIVTGHCLLRMKQRAEMNEPEALAAIAEITLFLNSDDITIGPKAYTISTGGELKAVCIRWATENHDDPLLFFKTYYPPEWVKE